MELKKFTQEERKLIREGFAVNATNDEFETFIYLAQEYGLDPVKKEIWFIKYNASAKPMIQTSRDGYLKMANIHPQFDGLESDMVYQGDTLSKRDNGSILIEYGDDHYKFEKNKLAGAFCNVFRKDRAVATSIFVSLKDYHKKGNGIWDQYTNAMILKVAESMALKRAFAISGLVTKEELEVDDDAENTATSKESVNSAQLQARRFNDKDEELITDDQFEQLEYELRDYTKIKDTVLSALGFKDFTHLQKNKFMPSLIRIRELKDIEKKR